MNTYTPVIQPDTKNRPPSTAAMRRVLSRMPQEICASLTPDQIGALDKALDFNNPIPHTVNLRVTLFGLFYLVVIAGPERRNARRRTEERKLHPLSTPGNIVFLAILSVIGMALGYAIRTLVVGG